MPLDDPGHDGEAYPGPFEFRRFVQSMGRPEEFVGKLHVEPDASFARPRSSGTSISRICISCPDASVVPFGSEREETGSYLC
jgi:hypothetical protein